MTSNLIAVNWSYQNSKTACNSSWKKTKPWLLYQHINKKKASKMSSCCKSLESNELEQKTVKLTRSYLYNSQISFFLILSGCFIAGLYIVSEYIQVPIIARVYSAKLPLYKISVTINLYIHKYIIYIHTYIYI